MTETIPIGRGIAEAFARHTKGEAHIILVGRNRAAADEIIASFPRPTSSSAKHEFLHCDVTRMKNIQRTTQDILSQHPKVNFLVLSPGNLNFTREDTEEGIDRTLALFYYGRWKFASDLAPALSKAAGDNEDAKVLTVLSAGNGGKIDLNDLELRNCSTMTAVRAVATYADLMIEVSPGVVCPKRYMCEGLHELGTRFSPSQRFLDSFLPRVGPYVFGKSTYLFRK